MCFNVVSVRIKGREVCDIWSDTLGGNHSSLLVCSPSPICPRHSSLAPRLMPVPAADATIEGHHAARPWLVAYAINSPTLTVPMIPQSPATLLPVATFHSSELHNSWRFNKLQAFPPALAAAASLSQAGSTAGIPYRCLTQRPESPLAVGDSVRPSTPTKRSLQPVRSLRYYDQSRRFALRARGIMSPPPPSPPVSPTLVGVSDSTSARQCWECQRRERVCDAAWPVCQRCRKDRIVCPGYKNTKPLTWLPPGKVTSRNRKQRGNASVQTLPSPELPIPELPSPRSDTQEPTMTEKKPKRPTKRSPAANSRKKSPATPIETEDDAKSIILQRMRPAITSPVLNSTNAMVNKEWCELIDAATYCKLHQCCNLAVR